MTDSSEPETEDMVQDSKPILNRVDPYEGMSLEDKAFAILSDLGMIHDRK
jgi:hypothetical protein